MNENLFFFYPFFQLHSQMFIPIYKDFYMEEWWNVHHSSSSMLLLLCWKIQES